MKIQPYLFFDGRCREAFEFYRSVLGGELWMMTCGESPDAERMPPHLRDTIIHARLTVGEAVLMASDSPPQWHEKPQGYSVSINVADSAEAERVFTALSEGGAVSMPMAETFFAARFGMCVDRYGTRWMVLGGQKNAAA